MLLQDVKISNLLSFPYYPDLKQAEAISFFSQGWFEGLRILIGNNASWKSNFVTIIEEFFSTLIFDFNYNTAHLNDPDFPLKSAISLLKNTTQNLHPNTKHPEKSSKIQISIQLSTNDFENIGFVCKYHKKLNHLIQKYSNLPLNFSAYSLAEIQNTKSTLTLTATFDEKIQEFFIDTNLLDNYDLFILQCIQYQKLLQILITIFNEKEKNPDERKRYLLKKTFAIINSQRDSFQFNNFIEPHDLINDIHYTKKSLSGYATTIWKLRSIFENFSQKQLLSWNAPESDMQKKLEKSDFFLSLSSTIERFLWKKLLVEYINHSISLSLQDQSKRPVYFNELSSWEKSLLMIIFALYGNDLKNGFLIINEPELHLHPQIQKELALLFEKLSQNQNSQFILSTNSPLFINESNITNVYRVFKEENQWSQIICPKINVDYDDATLIHMLKFENLSKIFFVNKIILVEGDTDAYFFSFYLNYLKSLPEWKHKIHDYEVININGKGSAKTWIRFLNKFNISNFFIGDRDNTVDYGFFTKAELNKFYLLANKAIKQREKHDKYTDYYNRLVKTILTFSPKKYKAIIKGIEKLYKDNIFILKEGAIESYISVERKGLGQVAHFCNHNFEERLKDPHFASQQRELEEIMHLIFQ